MIGRGREDRPRRVAAFATASALLLLGVVASSRPDVHPSGASGPVGRGAAPPAVPVATTIDPAAALRRAEEAVAAAEARYGPESREVATLLGETAQALWSLEAYRAAQPLAERALAIRMKRDPDSIELAGELYQVGELHRALGDYAGALRRLEEARALWSRLLGAGSPEVATALHYIAVVHQATGDREGARTRFEAALAIRLRRLGETHEQVAATLVALASLASEEGDAATADRLHARALAIWERLGGPDSPAVARGLSAWAARRAGAGDLASARRLLDRALAIRVAAFGPGHHLVARTEADLAAILALEGDAGGAERLARIALDHSRRSLEPDHPQVTSILVKLAGALASRGDRAGAVDAALEAESLGRRRFLRTGRGLTDGEALQYETLRVTGLGVALGVLATDRGDGGAGALRRRVLDEIFASRALVLDRLGRRDAGAGDDGESTYAAVRSALPEGAALVAYAHYRRLDASGREAAAEYLAVVLRRGDDEATVVPLGAAGPIDAAIAAWDEEVSTDPRLREPARAPAGEALRAAIWDPVADRVADAALVLVVPDGAISRVSFATLPAGDGRFLLETAPPFHYLGAERDLVRLRAPGRPGRGALFLGGVDFDAPERAADDAAPLSPRPIAPAAFDPLPGTAAEVESLRASWRGPGEALLLEGGAATAAALRRFAPGRRLLHVATHAWFIGPIDGRPAAGRAEAGEGGAASPSILSDRGLSFSGLALAGANRPDGEGILTADAIADLDLSSVEWAVLSACDGGAGHLLPGEGVIGLRRAFERAGARTVITSLWDADDGAARAFMRELYGARARGRATFEAVRDAGRALLEAERTSGRAPHPYYWGAFVAAGDWR